MPKYRPLTFAALMLLVAACGTGSTAAPSATLPQAEPTDTAPPPPTTPESQEPFDSPLSATDTFESPIALPNPASKYCEDQGYTLEMRTNELGVAGYCIFPDGTDCEEWAFFRGECGPGTPQP
jgi:putative hemolysin